MPIGRTLAVAALLVCAFLLSTRPLPPPVPRPVIYATDALAREAMRSAPLIVVVRISGAALTGDERMVPKPPEVGGPQIPAIPLSLARIQAEVLLTVHGPERTRIEFYSWVWTSGKHGGGRLFHPNPGGIRALFLREEAGLLHTVGDYPSYDLELRSESLPALLAGWHSDRMRDAEPSNRLVALLLRTQLESLTEDRLSEDYIPRGPVVSDRWLLHDDDLARLSGPLFLAMELDSLCLHSSNPATRFAACYLTAQSFPGRCQGYELALRAAPGVPFADHLRRLSAFCPKSSRWDLEELRAHAAGRYANYQLRPSPAGRREALRVYASGFDAEVRRAACALAAASETRDLPECAASRR